MLRLVLAALALALGAAPVDAQQQSAPRPLSTYTQEQLWSRSGERITFTLTGISLPIQAGATRLIRSVEASLQGRGLDNALLYSSQDEAVFVTVYIYAPALPDAALTAFMTDHAIRVQSGSEFRSLGTRTVAAGGREAVAIRADYAGFRQDRLASSAAFMQVGRWILKLRVTGPEPRRAEVEAAMAALLREIRFEGRDQPAAVTPIEAAACPPLPDRPARPVPSDDSETMADALMSQAIGEVEVGALLNGTPRWCRSAGYRVPDSIGPTPVLRDLNSGAGDDRRRRVLIALVSDSGIMFEVVSRRFRERTHYVLNYHRIGQSLVLGAYDAIPTDEQIRAIATGADQAGGVARATIDYEASGDSRIGIQTAPAPPVPRT